MAHDSDSGGSHRPATAPAWLGWLLPIGFTALALVLFAGLPRVDVPVAQPRTVDRVRLEVAPRRNAMRDPPHVIVAGIAQNCNGCHQIFASAHPAGAALSYHQEIRLSHGMNNRCINCHDPDDRERLTLRDGSRVAFADTPRLCAQCHGTVFRDWERGTHGKTLGSWITGSDAQRRLSCNECHDPHAPKYPPYVPLAGPHTLRMGPQGHDMQHAPGPGESPLQRWLSPEDGHDHAVTPHGDQP